MIVRGAGAVLLALLLAGCSSVERQPAPTASLTARDKTLLANAPYQKVLPPDIYQRSIVDYASTEKPGTLVVDTSKKYLYLVQDNGKAIRYGVTVGEEGLAFSGRAKVGRKAEWPTWRPTASIKQRMPEVPDFVGPGPHNPMGARALYLYQGNQDTLFRIHGTNQPEYIGQAISSGCIRLLNEDVIDLYTRVPQGAEVIVL